MLFTYGRYPLKVTILIKSRGSGMHDSKTDHSKTDHSKTGYSNAGNSDIVRWLSVLVASLLLVACADAESDPETSAFPWLTDLALGDEVQESGARLMAVPEGLHNVERESSGAENTLQIGVHGWASRGYEWVYPLQMIDTDEHATYWYRWDYQGCAVPAAEALEAAVQKVLAERPELTRVRIVGHSYGGVLVTSLIENWSLGVPVEIHAVAAPLARAEGENPCPYRTPTRIAENVTFHEWRTLHHLDGAFKDRPVDPQIINLAGSQVTRLPDTYNGRRLGHNWSISWVADEISQR